VLVKPDDIKPPPEFSSSLKAEYLSGLCKFEDRLLILVEIDRLILGKDLALFNDVEEPEATEVA
jgi:purine-binding chemotaxis protein CheW